MTGIYYRFDINTLVFSQALLIHNCTCIGTQDDPGHSHPIKAMDDIGVVMTPFWDVEKVILVANSYVFYRVARGNDRINFSGVRHPWP